VQYQPQYTSVLQPKVETTCFFNFRISTALFFRISHFRIFTFLLFFFFFLLSYALIPDRGILLAAGQLVRVQGDIVTVNGVVRTITGTSTFTVVSGVTVKRMALGDYVVSYPTGNTRFIQRR
jgi:hypothetical protein